MRPVPPFLRGSRVGGFQGNSPNVEAVPMVVFPRMRPRRSLLFVAPCLLLLSGCIDFGHCGLTLSGVDYRTRFAGELDPSNRSIGRTALEQMGFVADKSLDGPGGFFMRKDDVSVFLQDGAAAGASGIGFEYGVDL